MMENEFDIYENLNIGEDLIQDHDWKYLDGDNPKIFYQIDDSTTINIEFIGYRDLCNDQFLSGGKTQRRGMIVKMIQHYGNIFKKKVNHYSKDYFLVRKMRKIIKRKGK